MIAVNDFVMQSRPAQLPGALCYRCARLGVKLRRRLSILLCAGWIPHDRGCVLELPLSENERQPFKDWLTMLPKGSPPCSTPSLAHQLNGAFVLNECQVGVTSCAIAQMKPTISRAIAVLATTVGLPQATRCLWRRHIRIWPFQAMSRTPCGRPSIRSTYLRPTRDCSL